MKIAVIGVGNVGGALGKLWAVKGHEVVLGVRDPQAEKVQAVLQDAPGARAATVAGAVAFADVIALATPSSAVESAIKAAQDWHDKIIIDATNPFPLPPNAQSSIAEYIAQLAPGAKVAKAFNTIGAAHLANPSSHGQAASMFVCGDDPARDTAMQLAAELGFEVVDCGPLSNARLLEAMALLWVDLAYTQGLGGGIAFKLLM